MIYREHYINPVREFYDSDLIKIITGIRRSGKSVILEQIRNEIKQKTDNLIYLNFEDKRILTNISNSEFDFEEGNKNMRSSYKKLARKSRAERKIKSVKRGIFK